MPRQPFFFAYFTPLILGDISVKLKIGDRVSFLDSSEKGILVSIKEDQGLVKTTDGFELWQPLSKLVYDGPVKIVQHRKAHKKEVKPAKTSTPDFLDLPKKETIKKVVDKQFKVSPHLIGEDNPGKKNKYSSSNNVWEVDLHIEEIIDRYSHLNNAEIIQIQLNHARDMIEKAIKNKVLKIVFIHGKGTGRLRQELISLLAGYTHLEFYDASFQKYGGGATEVKLYISKIG